MSDAGSEVLTPIGVTRGRTAPRPGVLTATSRRCGRGHPGKRRLISLRRVHRGAQPSVVLTPSTRPITLGRRTIS
ncbi:hypothetical protein [Nocardioides insulae]|uniref:hypothetical protein n=1 Tax=Nocardioides insulae TaxID=394734 RepID=UPI00146ACEE6|nr:hypothetical protein [Nocardioides insulae]